MPTLILSPIEEKAAMRNIIWSQCLAIVALGTVGNGTLLLYLTAIGASAVRTMSYLAILPLTNATLLLPAAFLADRYGKKQIGQIGLTIGIFGWGIISLGSFTGDGRKGHFGGDVVVVNTHTDGAVVVRQEGVGGGGVVWIANQW